MQNYYSKLWRFVTNKYVKIMGIVVNVGFVIIYVSTTRVIFAFQMAELLCLIFCSLNNLERLYVY